jgi:hypothetical protein
VPAGPRSMAVGDGRLAGTSAGRPARAEPPIKVENVKVAPAASIKRRGIMVSGKSVKVVVS